METFNCKFNPSKMETNELPEEVKNQIKAEATVTIRKLYLVDAIRFPLRTVSEVYTERVNILQGLCEFGYRLALQSKEGEQMTEELKEALPENPIIISASLLQSKEEEVAVANSAIYSLQTNLTALTSENERLREVLRKLYNRIENGSLVKNTSRMLSLDMELKDIDSLLSQSTDKQDKP